MMNFSRRKFLKAAGITSVSGMLLGNTSFAADRLWSSNSDTLKVGLIGCGGRGTAAAMEAL
ncbi:MAG: twin-arginine translocation signal domain-containing protein, partial [Sphingobacterium sp.]